MSRSRTYLEAGTPLLGFVDFVPQGDGTYRPVPRPPVQMVSITQAAKVTQKSREQIYRLYKTGFVTGDQSTPGKIMVDLQSLHAHLQGTRDDPDYWTPARLAQYRGR